MSKRRLTLSYRVGAAALIAALVIGVLLGVLVARSRADDDRALAADRSDQVAALRRERSNLVAARPPGAARAPDPPTTTTAPTPTATTPTTAPTTASPAASAQQELVALPARSAAPVPPYDRGQFGPWIDADGDCQDTRAEVLVAESITPAVGGCTIASGTWDDPYTGTRITVAHDLDIDHMVPLSNAWTSGAWAWAPAQRVAYANFLEDPAHLIAVSASANRSKGDRSPDEWRPPNQSFWCTYAVDWIDVKTRWTLSVSAPERQALGSMLATC